MALVSAQMVEAKTLIAVMNGSRDLIPYGDEKKAIDDGWDNVSISSTETIEVANCSQRFLFNGILINL